MEARCRCTRGIGRPPRGSHEKQQIRREGGRDLGCVPRRDCNGRLQHDAGRLRHPLPESRETGRRGAHAHCRHGARHDHADRTRRRRTGILQPHRHAAQQRACAGSPQARQLHRPSTIRTRAPCSRCSRTADAHARLEGELGNIRADANGSTTGFIVATDVSLDGVRSIISRVMLHRETTDSYAMYPHNVGPALACGGFTHDSPLIRRRRFAYRRGHHGVASFA